MEISQVPPKFAPWAELIQHADRQLLGGALDEAVVTYQRALQWVEDYGSRELVSTVFTLEKIAIAYLKNQPAKALHWFEKSITLLRSNPSSGIELATSLNKYASALKTAGRFDDAEAAINEGCSIYGQYLGPHHHFIPILRIEHARILRLRGRLSTAREVAATARAALSNQPQCQDSYIEASEELANIYVKCGRTLEAVSILTDCIRRADAVWSESEIDGALLIAGLRMNLADVLAACGDTQAAGKHAWDAVATLEKHLPAESPELVDMKNRAATILKQVQSTDEANLLLEVMEEDELESLNLANRRWRYLFVR